MNNPVHNKISNMKPTWLDCAIANIYYQKGMAYRLEVRTKESVK